jgi:hypothetical protein
MRTSARQVAKKRWHPIDHSGDQAELELNRAEQAGDLQGLSGVGEADSESVRDLVEEGQAFEAEVIDAVENAADPDVAEVTTREVPVDDVPSEYLDEH